MLLLPSIFILYAQNPMEIPFYSFFLPTRRWLQQNLCLTEVDSFSFCFHFNKKPFIENWELYFDRAFLWKWNSICDIENASKILCVYWQRTKEMEKNLLNTQNPPIRNGRAMFFRLVLSVFLVGIELYFIMLSWTKVASGSE